MQKQFKREQRYFVVKVKDAKEYLDAHQLEKLAEIADTISEGREKDGIPAVDCVVVESDWPEYELTWKAIEARVTGVQPAQKAVAYLDLGAGGYMDIGTDLNDEQLASLPKGRHMLGIVGTYGVDGYVSAQPAPSVPENVMRDARRYLWLRNAALDWYVGPEYATYNDVVCSGECCNYAGGGVALDSAIDALLAAAQEPKP